MQPASSRVCANHAVLLCDTTAVADLGGIQGCDGTPSGYSLMYVGYWADFRPSIYRRGGHTSGALCVHLTTLEPPFRNSRFTTASQHNKSFNLDNSNKTLHDFVCKLHYFHYQPLFLCAHTNLQYIRGAIWLEILVGIYFRQLQKLFH